MGELRLEPWDLPITKGLQQSVRDFERMDEEVELLAILEQLAALPPPDLAYSEETEAKLPELVYGLSLGLARTFKILDPKPSRTTSIRETSTRRRTGSSRDRPEGAAARFLFCQPFRLLRCGSRTPWSGSAAPG
jgi:hypothetical protein